MELTATNKFFINLAVQKVCAKLVAQGFNADQAAEMITRPGHMVDILKLAEHLNIQAFDHIAAL